MNLLRNITWINVSHFLLMTSLTGSVSCDRSHPEVLIQTNLGEIVVELYTDKAPITATSFLSLVDQDVYTNAIFYRVVRMDNQPHSRVKIEVIQGGLFDDERVNMYSPIAHETTENTGIKHTDGVISMARNEPGSASTEFFICVGDQPELDFGGERNPDKQGFAAFGKVTRGMELVRIIQARPDSGQYLVNPVHILEMKRNN